MIQLEEITDKEFLVGVRGYVREEVQAFLRVLSEEIRVRDERIGDLEAKLEESARADHERSLAALMGTEVSAIIGAADSLATNVKDRSRSQIDAISKHTAALLAAVADVQSRFAAIESGIANAARAIENAADELLPQGTNEASTQIRVIAG